MRKISYAVLLLLIPAALAWGAPKTADQWYDEGANQYTLGNFDKAIEAFKQGFSLEPDEGKKASYLYNIAQAYRQSNDCRNALFFYKRYLANTAKPIPPKTRKEVEAFIAELEVCVKQQTQVSQKPPVNNVPPGGVPSGGNGGDKDHPPGGNGGDKDHPPGGDTGHKEPRKDVAVGQKPPEGDGDQEDSGVTQTATGGQPRLISARLIGGGSKVSAGSISVPFQATFGLVGGYPIPINPRLTIEAGAAFTYTPTPYVGVTTNASNTGSLVAVLANAGATYEVIPKLGIRGDLGLGALLFGGISDSPFTSGAMTTGALTMFHLRVAASADYAIIPNLVLTAMPVAFSYSPAASGIVGGGSITSFDFMVGIGYRK